LKRGLLDRPKARYRGIVTLGVGQVYGVAQSFLKPVALILLVMYTRDDFAGVSRTHVEPSTPVATEIPRT
jgi:hypothetical protein